MSRLRNSERRWPTIRRPGLAALACALIVAGAPARAADADSAHTCIDPARDTADGIAACLGEVRKAADARLNATYRAALASLDGDDRDTLREGQRAWLAFRVRDRASLLDGAWRARRGTYVRIAAAEADVAAINAREFELRAYLPGTTSAAKP